jgi:hypothetical protein
MKKVLKNIVYILFLIITLPFLIIYFAIKVIMDFLENIYFILTILEDKISSIKTK